MVAMILILYYLADRFKMVEVSVGWCPRGGMIGDYMTKPLQGDIFQKFREKSWE